MLGAVEPAEIRRPGALARYWHAGRTLFADYGGPLLAVTVLGANVIRIRLAPEGIFAPRRSWGVPRPDEAYPAANIAIAETSERVSVMTDRLLVGLARAGGRVSVQERHCGAMLLDDGPAGGPLWHRADGSAAWIKRMPPDEHYYGFGERTGLLDKRGLRYTCWTTDEYQHQGPGTDALYQAIPFFLALHESGRSYGVFLNNTFRSAFDFTAVQQATWRMEIAGGELDYYFFYGPEPAQVVEHYTELTGRPPLPPRWALGYQQSRWSYESEPVVRDLAAEFRRRQIPCDVIYLDIDHMDGQRVFTWDRERFPDPAGLIADLGKQGFKVVPIIDVGVKHQPEGGYKTYAEGAARGCFIKKSRAADAEEFLCYVWPGLCAFPDFARAEVREWWGGCYREFLDHGISGFWNDMNEPAMHDTPYDQPGSSGSEPPLDTPQGPDDEPTTHAEARNVYAYLENQATYTALRHMRPGQRPFVLTRAGYAGIQRYAAVWTGDNGSYWEHLEMSLPQLLNLGLSGVAFAGADIGGFFANGGPELLARWMQLGALYPLARASSAKGCASNEPWAWGEQAEQISRRAIELRYQLLPYLYSLFEEAARTGAPIARPLFYHYPADSATHLIHDQALLGRDLLLAPILRPGKVCREVYLPAGIWYDLRSGERLAGPRQLLAEARLEALLPLYARGGAVIPGGPVMQWIGERPLDRLTLDVYLDENGVAEGLLYEDDGMSFDYEQGSCCRTFYQCRADAATGAPVLHARREGAYVPPARSVAIRLHRAGDIRLAELPADQGDWQVALGR
jgi:alpha-glucosidase